MKLRESTGLYMTLLPNLPELLNGNNQNFWVFLFFFNLRTIYAAGIFKDMGII